ncbi:AAA family ATPase [Rhizobium leguminosarum]|uniref:ATP-binding protein n=1 Tax=Rhizobium leguminosarum TaxID=384 RepID=UPI001C939973|nr:AAA family ATPase [Rhizobium leguminosarum]MBY5714728.1 AAA family ATPase [Rhizobium leguminosarum]
MVASTAVFSFDENADLESNLANFETHLRLQHALLSGKLATFFSSLRVESYISSSLWDDLFQAIPDAEAAAGQQAASQPRAVGATPGSVVASVAGPNGWFLEGLSVEGFRGINNEGKPLELRFKSDKVNSVSAVNGVGKTSVYDAIRYAISGRLPWLEELPPGDRDGEYYLNRFHGGQAATIKLSLRELASGQACEIDVKRDNLGNRTVSASGTWDGDAILQSLNREFVLLDGPTFQNFIAAKPQARGRTFAGLLGLSDYSKIRQALAALANTRAFNNHFGVQAHTQLEAHAQKGVNDAREAFKRDYLILTGGEWSTMSLSDGLTKSFSALEQIGPLTALCTAKSFREIDVDACIEAVKAAEGGPKRDRLGECVRLRQELVTLNVQGPDAGRIGQLAKVAKNREEAVAKTAGDVILQLYQAGAKALELPEWANKGICPLCDSEAPHDLHGHVTTKLADFTALDEATQAVGLEWNEGGWADLIALEKLLEPDNANRKIAALSDTAQKGVLTEAQAQNLATWLGTLRQRASDRDSELEKEQRDLEKVLPQSSVEVTKKVEAARRMQETLGKLDAAQSDLNVERKRAGRVSRLKAFLDQASDDFGVAEANISKARLAAVEPVFKTYFAEMSFFGVTPAVVKRTNSEDLQIRLQEFHGLADLSPQALLSESYRNAFAIALYLAAASLYGGMPKFIVLDDVTSSFDAGHQLYLVELLRKSFARPANANGLQVIILSHDTMLEKLFNKHTGSGVWWHQRLEGNPQFAVLPQTGAVNKVRDHTISMLQAGQADFGKEGVRQYLEYRLSDLISKLRIPVPVDVAFNDNKQLASEFLSAIEAAVKLHKAAGSLILDAAQEAGLNANVATIVGNFTSHWGTGQALAFTAPALLGVMNAIDQYCDCFTFEPNPAAPRKFYRSLSQKN